MKRLAVLQEINLLMTGNCSVCKTRTELYREYKSAFSRIDGYCNKQCPVGSQLQVLGKNLMTG